MTLRLPNGIEHRMCRWTNIMPWAFTNLALIESRPEHIAALLEQWLLMKADWEKSQAAGTKPENNMTDFYAPHQVLAPNGYGLVVVDMVNKVIAHSQGYTDIGTIFSASFHDGPTSDPDSNAYRFKQLFDSGKIKEFRQWGREKPPITDFAGMSADAVITSLGMAGDRTGDFIVDMSPYTVERYAEHDYASAVKLRERVLELGFVLTSKEEELWNDWFESCKEMDGAL